MMFCLRLLQRSRVASVRSGIKCLSSASKRPLPKKSENEMMVEKSQNIYKNSPTTAKVISFWGASSSLKKGLLFLIAGSFGYIYIKIVYRLYKNSEKQKENVNKVKTYGELSVGGPFELVDTNGNPVTTESLKGKWALLYFGFTYCPDICPEQMEMMANVVDIAEEEHDIEVVPLMVTIDLERDTPQVLAEYVAEYSSKIIGLLGTEEQVDHVCNLYRCYRSKGQAYDDPNDYILDHTVTQYIIDPDGKTVGYFMSNRGLEERVPILLDHVQKYREHKENDQTKTEDTSMFEGIKNFLGFNTTAA